MLRAEAVVDLAAIRNNVSLLKERTSADVLAVVKADGYGHGLVPSARAALKGLTAPVLLYAGDLDPIATPAVVRQAAPLFRDAAVVVQPHAAHFPWVDDPAPFAAAIGSLPAASSQA